jgi:hypothetical protein
MQNCVGTLVQKDNYHLEGINRNILHKNKKTNYSALQVSIEEMFEEVKILGRKL